MKTPHELLPHDPPMVFISEVCSFDTDAGILTARARIQKSDILYQSAMGGVPAYAALEYMAQTIGCLVGLNDLAKGQSPRVGFVLGTRKLQVHRPVLALDKSFLIRATALFCDDNTASFDCTLSDESTNAPVATAIVNAYRPENIHDFMKEYS